MDNIGIPSPEEYKAMYEAAREKEKTALHSAANKANLELSDKIVVGSRLKVQQAFDGARAESNQALAAPLQQHQAVLLTQEELEEFQGLFSIVNAHLLPGYDASSSSSAQRPIEEVVEAADVAASRALQPPPQLPNEEIAKKFGIRPRGDNKILRADATNNKEGGAHVVHLVTRSAFNAERPVEAKLQILPPFQTGTFAKVSRMIQQIEGRSSELVYKSAKAGGESDVKRDFHHSRAISADGDVWGIKPPPLYMVTLPGDPVSVGFADTKYDEDLYEYSAKLSLENRTPERILPLAHQLLNGGAYLRFKKVLHIDIKTENVLIRRDPETQLLLAHHADFGGVAFEKDIGGKDLNEFSRNVPYTPEVTAAKDAILLTGFIADNKKEEYLALADKMMTFQLGVALYTLFTGNSTPYPLMVMADSHLYLSAEEANYREINRTSIQPPLEELIKEMLSSSPEKRPSLMEAKERFDAILAEHYPQIGQSIQASMGNLGYL